MQLNSSLSAIVTGGASGLGEATARRLAAEGVKVTIFDMNLERGSQVADEIGALACRVDVTSDADVVQGLAAARAAHGQERILVNCAGIVLGAKTVARRKTDGVLIAAATDDFDRVVRVNLGGTFRCIAHSALGMAGLDRLATGERGVIISTASVAAEDGQVGQAAYAASKAGVAGMALPIARDLASEGVRVNTILPGLFETPMMAGLPAAVRASLAATVPFPDRLGAGEEYAALVVEMCRNAYLNAAAIRLDGALRMAAR
ncbi:SDR family NAD(P)-dependent oxidoreductase [Caulobacter rhizosphaerae]|uniref:SDR family NAD(P)-dependent oxidoreductase n=1 Tax=Caulobacter rhizosphaerae TaxID=2010972 RepID=UPI0013D8B907|nr:SDR family NAD(P)-dependent oxidoreductase [Caulobacter rhizosphaerae]GGL35245.1 3-hydroxyacyl-CoA dehydrogenase [Caulobacter rhizosphaerae]